MIQSIFIHTSQIQLASNSFTNTTEGSSIIFDRIPPKLDNVTISNGDADIGFKNFIMSGSLLNIFTANEELRRKVSSPGFNSVSAKRNCVGACCINPIVTRKYWLWLYR